MSDEPRLGRALSDALDAMEGPVEFAPGEIEADVIELQRRLAEARRAMDEFDLEAFVASGAVLGLAVQRRLFADPSLRARFQALRRQHAAYLSPTRVAEIPSQIAAADTPRLPVSRAFPGGQLEVSEVGIERQVYLVIRFDDADIATRALMIEPAGDRPPRRVDLPPPNGREFVLIQDLAVADEAELIELLLDPATTATFLR